MRLPLFVPHNRPEKRPETRACGLFAAVLFFLVLRGALCAAAPLPEDPQLLRVTGTLPAQGRVVIRSGLAWMDEDSPRFALLARELGQGLAARGLSVADAPLSVLEPLPKGSTELRDAPVPEIGRRGRRQRPMSMQEAVARMQAMQLAREGKLPQTRFAAATDVLAGVPVAGNRTAAPIAPAPAPKRQNVQPNGSVAQPVLAGAELARFALSQEQGVPELRGQVSIPARVPLELRITDPAIADYALVARFAMLWPAASQSGPVRRQPLIAAGWHLLELACYDLAPARVGKEPRRIWIATVQRVAQSSEMSVSVPQMGREAVLAGYKP